MENKKEPKFKVGDYVKVLLNPPTVDGFTNGLIFGGIMEQHKGSTVKIELVTKWRDDFSYKVYGNPHIWHEEWLEPATRFDYEMQNTKTISLNIDEGVVSEIRKRPFFIPYPSEDYDKHILGKWGVCNELIGGYFYEHLPLKIVFDEKSGRTTLLFGNENYDPKSKDKGKKNKYNVVRADAKGKFNEKVGFLIGMIKYLLPKQLTKNVIDLGYERYNKFKNNLTNYFETILRTSLDGISTTQLNKLFDNIDKKDELIFDFEDGRHIIEIERK